MFPRAFLTNWLTVYFLIRLKVKILRLFLWDLRYMDISCLKYNLSNCLGSYSSFFCYNRKVFIVFPSVNSILVWLSECKELGDVSW